MLGAGVQGHSPRACDQTTGPRTERDLPWLWLASLRAQLPRSPAPQPRLSRHCGFLSTLSTCAEHTPAWGSWYVRPPPARNAPCTPKYLQDSVCHHHTETWSPAWRGHRQPSVAGVACPPSLSVPGKAGHRVRDSQKGKMGKARCLGAAPTGRTVTLSEETPKGVKEPGQSARLAQHQSSWKEKARFVENPPGQRQQSAQSYRRPGQTRDASRVLGANELDRPCQSRALPRGSQVRLGCASPEKHTSPRRHRWVKGDQGSETGARLT